VGENIQGNDYQLRQVIGCRHEEDEILTREERFESTCGHALTVSCEQLSRLRPKGTGNRGSTGLTPALNTRQCAEKSGKQRSFGSVGKQISPPEAPSGEEATQSSGLDPTARRKESQ
jgi:hypothetical protein